MSQARSPSRIAPRNAGIQAELSENELLLREGRKIVEALGRMFTPCCAVVLHDLTRPEHAIIAIESPPSGRKVGDAATEMGLARIADPGFSEVVQNYPATFPDGRPAKSTSIGLKNSQGAYVAAICLNLDISLFSSMRQVLEQLTTSTPPSTPVRESFRARSLDEVRTTIENFAARFNQQPRTLSPVQRREVVAQLASTGLLRLRGAASMTAKILGISRASVYNATHCAQPPKPPLAIRFKGLRRLARYKSMVGRDDRVSCRTSS